MNKNKSKNNNEFLNVIIESIKEKKGKNILQISLSKLENSIADNFIICHADSTTQVEAIADNIERKIKEKFSVNVKNIEGKRNGEWVLIDFFDIVVHVFQAPVRNTYNLEGLWADGEFVYHEDVA
ncbi:MAG: ribosome silencing factor [Salinivirgaceae bacterium]|nr:ribosome silencing factor [Salinivirgaceae bacterium]MDD4747703.1 ribosome silencing factor [Salinivirgaceae bacterium]MDY0279262.1 ribosome silencing factor [Salinivirgaceae bacterium]